MNQNQRDRRAIRTILKHMGGEATYPDIALRGGEGLASPLLEMVQEGEITKQVRDGRSYYSSLSFSLDEPEESS
jgi:hypothetical protein